MNLSDILKKKRRRFLSIDFGQAFVKILYLESHASGLRLLDHDLKKISLSDSTRPEIVKFINNFLKKNSITEKEANLNIAGPDSVIIKHLTLPVLPRQEILEAAKWQLKDIVQADLNDFIIDWQIVKEFVGAQGAKKNIILFALTNKDVVNKCISIVFNCGLNPVSVSSDPFNYANILKQSKEKSDLQALLNIGYNHTSICIYKNSKLQFIRELPYSTEKLIRSLSGTLISDKGTIELTQEKAEKMIEEIGVPKDDTEVFKDGIKAMQIISLIRPVLEQLVKEVRLSLEYFSSNFKEETLPMLYIAGGSSGLKNLSEYLSKELGIKIERLSLPERIIIQGVQRERVERDQAYILNALGSSLSDLRAINLMPAEIKARKTELVSKSSMRVISVAVSAVFLVSLVFVRVQLRDYKSRLVHTKLHLETIKEIKVLTNDIEEKEIFMDQLRLGRIPTEGLLKLISAMVPGEVMLDELYLEQESHKLFLKGAISAKDQIIEKILTMFMEKMEASSFFREATLASSVKNEGTQQFEIRCDLAF